MKINNITVRKYNDTENILFTDKKGLSIYIDYDSELYNEQFLNIFKNGISKYYFTDIKIHEIDSERILVSGYYLGLKVDIFLNFFE